MATLEHRLTKLEAVALKVNLDDLSDEELSDHIAGLPFKSAQGYRAIVNLVLRHPSAFPVAHDDPDHVGGKHDNARKKS